MRYCSHEKYQNYIINLLFPFLVAHVIYMIYLWVWYGSVLIIGYDASLEKKTDRQKKCNGHFCLAWTVFRKRLRSLILYVVCTVCMYVVCSMYVVICKIDQCIHIHWCIPMGLGYNDPWVKSHMWPQQMWVKGHLGVSDLWFKFLQKGSLYPHTLMYFHGTWTQWSLGRNTHVTSTAVGSKVI